MGWSPRTWVLVGAAVVGVVVLVVVLVVRGGGDDDEPAAVRSPSTTTTATSAPPSSTAPTTSTAPVTTAPPPTTIAPSDPPAPAGVLEVVLTWPGGADLDLHVTEPGGFEITYATGTSPSGGALQDDSEGQCPSCREVVRWPAGAAPTGRYEVVVEDFTGGRPVAFTLEVRRGDEVLVRSDGTVGAPVTFVIR